MASFDRPKIENVSAGDLVKWARDGRIRIPALQRPYRWDRSDVVNLLDSVLRGYPMGNLLVWQHPAQSGAVELGPLRVQAPASGDAYWVIDGQQRITSLVGALAATSETSDPRFRIYLDLDEGKFISASRRQEPATDWLPVATMLSTAEANAWIRARPHLSADQIALADQAIASVRDYKIPMYVVTGEDEAALRDIFDRLNTFGKRLKRAEVFNALNSGAGEREPSDLRSLADGVRALGFGSFSEQLLMQTLLTIRGRQADRNYREEFTSGDDLHQAMLATEKAVGHVVDYLRDFADVPHLLLLPYSLVVPVLARFIHSFGPPEGRAAELLRRWIWRGAVLGMAPQGNTVAIRQGSAAIAGSPVLSASALLRLLPTAKTAWTPDLTQTRLNRAQAKVNIMGMMARAPQLLPADEDFPGEPVDTLTLLESRRVFTAIAQDPASRSTGLPDHLIHPSRRHVDELLVNSDLNDEFLYSQCLDEPSIRLLREQRMTDFLAYRAAVITPVISKHVQDRALFGFRDGPDISSLFDAGADGEDA